MGPSLARAACSAPLHGRLATRARRHRQNLRVSAALDTICSPMTRRPSRAPGGGAREMDEPYPNYPADNRRTALDMPREFVTLTAAAYFFMPSLTALRTLLA